MTTLDPRDFFFFFFSSLIFIFDQSHLMIIAPSFFFVNIVLSIHVHVLLNVFHQPGNPGAWIFSFSFPTSISHLATGVANRRLKKHISSLKFHDYVKRRNI
jgi:hypothetical protein